MHQPLKKIAGGKASTPIFDNKATQKHAMVPMAQRRNVNNNVFPVNACTIVNREAVVVNEIFNVECRRTCGTLPKKVLKSDIN